MSKLVFLSFVACLFSGSVWANRVVLKNGDRVTGHIVKKDGKNLTIKSGLFGDVTMPWDQVESIQTDQPVTVVLSNGRTAQGTLATAEGKVEVAAPAAKLSAAHTEIATIRNAAEQSAYERLQTRLARTVDRHRQRRFRRHRRQRQNAELHHRVDAARVTTTDKTSIHFDSIKASALVNGKNADTASAVHAGIGYDHNFDGRLFANAFNNWEYDRFQGLDLRFVLRRRHRIPCLQRPRSQFDVLAGPTSIARTSALRKRRTPPKSSEATPTL